MRYLEVFNWPPIFNMTNNKLFSVLILVVILSLILIIPFIVFGENMEGLVSGLLENNSAGRPFLFAVIIVLLLASDVLLPVASSILSSWSGYCFGFVQGRGISTVGMMPGCVCGYYPGVYGCCMVGDNHKGICESVSEKYGYWAVAANFWGSSLITVIESTQIINADELCRKLTEYQKQKLKKQLRRRAVIEPVTGRLK